MTWFAPKPGERILDVGFGQGQALKFLANWVGPNGRAIGIEPNLERVAALDDELRSEGPVSPVGLVGNADALPFYDCACHLPSIERYRKRTAVPLAAIMIMPSRTVA